MESVVDKVMKKYDCVDTDTLGNSSFTGRFGQRQPTPLHIPSVGTHASSQLDQTNGSAPWQAFGSGDTLVHANARSERTTKGVWRHPGEGSNLM